MRTGTVAGCRGATALILGARLLLAAAAPDANAEPAQPATEVGSSVRDLKAALDEIERRVEQQRQGAGTAPAGDPAGEFRADPDRTEGLARTMLQLRAERDGLRAQLLQARDELTRANAELARQREEARTAVAGREAEVAAARQEAERLRQSVARGEEQRRALEAALTEARTGAGEGRSEAERRLAGEVESLRGQLERAEREDAERRTTALASVQQVRSASDQLLAALAERGRLTAAEEPRSGEAPQPTAEGEGTGTAAPLVREASDRAGGPASAGTGGGVRDKAVLDGDLFAAGGDRLAAGAAEPLARVARLIKGTRGEVRIVGHTDPGGDPKRNLQASVRRARAVRDYLVRTYGFDAGRFEVAAEGGEEPVTTDGTPVGRAASRRVEVLLSR